MRSSKSRSRSKSNRSRSVGNIVNRVFDSSGPEGKVRGTPQQIIDKYNQLARDAQLGNDRVATENFQQHAEHYTRMLSEAQREQDARREAQEAQNRERQQQHQGDNRGGDQPRNDPSRNEQPRNDQPRNEQPRSDQPDEQPRVAQPEPVAESASVIEIASEGDSGLVETPESAPARPKPRGRGRPRKSDAAKAEAAQPQPEAPAAPGDDTTEAAE